MHFVYLATNVCICVYFFYKARIWSSVFLKRIRIWLFFYFYFFLVPEKAIWMRKIFTSATIWPVWIVTFGINNKNFVFSFDMFPSCCISHFIWCIEALPSGILINLLALQRRRVLLKDSHEVFVRTKVQYTVLSRSKYNSILALSL